MRFLVTGGSGFVGSHLTERLLESGHEVTVLDNFSTSNQKNLQSHKGDPNLKVIPGSILDTALVQELISGKDGCFHLAAAVGVKTIVENPVNSLITNIRGSEVVLEAAQKYVVPTLVTSTSEIYGKNKSEKISEESDRILGSPLISRWTYSEAKAIEELLAYELWKTSKIKTHIVRLFNTVGPRQLGDYGMVIPRLIRSALLHEDMIVHGEGNQTRTFCHVADAVSGILAVWNSEATVGKAINIGGNEEITINALAERIKKIAGSSSQIIHIPHKVIYEHGFEDIPRRVPDIGRAESLTGWTPKKTLDDIIKDTISEMKKNL